MKKVKSRVATILAMALTIGLLCLGLVGCGRTVNLQTQKEAVTYVKDYIMDNNKGKKIAEKIGLYASAADAMEFESSSYANHEDGVWLVVIHGHMKGGQFSYIAEVTTSGKITELQIIKGIVTNFHKN